jgi:hypothetical protein
MISKSGLAIVIVAIVVIMFVVLFFSHIININNYHLSSSARGSILSNVSTIPSMFTAAQSLYNSSGPFNISYNFNVSLIYISIGNSSSPRYANGTFQIARYGNSIRAYSTLSANSSFNQLNIPLLTGSESISIYNGSYLTICSKSTFTNETPVNSSIESQIVSANSAPMRCTSTSLIVSPFDMITTYIVAPFEMSYITNFTSLEQSEGTVHFIGYKTYLERSCLMEELIPPQNETGSKGVSINDCLSPSNGLPLYFDLEVNGSSSLKDTISAINAAPSNANVITSLPSGAVLS